MGNISVDHIIFARAPSLVSHFPTCSRLVGFFFRAWSQRVSMQNIAIPMWSMTATTLVAMPARIKRAKNGPVTRFQASLFVRLNDSFCRLDATVRPNKGPPFKTPRVPRSIFFYYGVNNIAFVPDTRHHMAQAALELTWKIVHWNYIAAIIRDYKPSTQRVLKSRVSQHIMWHISRRIARDRERYCFSSHIF